MLESILIEKCPRCQKLFDEKKQEWDKADKTLELISQFNSDKLLVENFGQITFKDAFCPDCQGLFPGMTVAEFRERTRSKTPVAEKN